MIVQVIMSTAPLLGPDDDLRFGQPKWTHEVEVSEESTIEDVVNAALKQRENTNLLEHPFEIWYAKDLGKDGYEVADHIQAIEDRDGHLEWLNFIYSRGNPSLKQLKRGTELETFQARSDTIVVAEPSGAAFSGPWPWEGSVEFLRLVGDVGGGLYVLRSTFRWFPRVIKRFFKGRGEERTKTLASDLLWLQSFVDRHKDHWTKAGAYNLDDFLIIVARPLSWDSGQLRHLLDIDPAEAGRLLTILGYVWNANTKRHELANSGSARESRNFLLREVLRRRRPI